MASCLFLIKLRFSQHEKWAMIPAPAHLAPGYEIEISQDMPLSPVELQLQANFEARPRETMKPSTHQFWCIKNIIGRKVIDHDRSILDILV